MGLLADSDPAQHAKYLEDPSKLQVLLRQWNGEEAALLLKLQKDAEAPGV